MQYLSVCIINKYFQLDLLTMKLRVELCVCVYVYWFYGVSAFCLRAKQAKAN